MYQYGTESPEAVPRNNVEKAPAFSPGALRKHVGDEVFNRVSRMLDAFSWDIPAILSSRNAEFVTAMRRQFSTNTRRMYCSKLSKVMEAPIVRGMFDSTDAYNDAMCKWRLTRRNINADEDMCVSPASSSSPVSLQGQEATDPYREIMDMSRKAHAMADDGNVQGAIRYLLDCYLESRTHQMKGV